MEQSSYSLIQAPPYYGSFYQTPQSNNNGQMTMHNSNYAQMCHGIGKMVASQQQVVYGQQQQQQQQVQQQTDGNLMNAAEWSQFMNQCVGSQMLNQSSNEFQSATAFVRPSPQQQFVPIEDEVPSTPQENTPSVGCYATVPSVLSDSSPLMGSDFGLADYTQWAFVLPPNQHLEVAIGTPPTSPLPIVDCSQVHARLTPQEMIRRQDEFEQVKKVRRKPTRKSTPKTPKIPKTPGIEETFTCPHCDRVFGKSWRLRTHQANVHLRLRPHQCPQCHMAFRSPYDLRRHSTIHTGERFACDNCFVSFGSKQRVANHLKNSEECWPRFGRPVPAIRVRNVHQSIPHITWPQYPLF